ncbi:MAG: winged helix DNA-binding domain-containing protein [Rhodospirillum sp.]|nr:winged helix DNA-binding domain-containing protein [Rhodospirillum sp.]MCF8500587.1 winged helix DNA-binding domain-containing protein [Rhodospirillum sp.]
MDLTATQARRIALRAAGLGRSRPRTEPGAKHLASVLDRLGLLQIDSINVLARAHRVPLFSRLGPYGEPLLAGASQGPRRTLFEYWGHEASLIRLDLHPLLRWRMADARACRGIYGGLARFARENRPLIDGVLERVAKDGPATARALSPEGEGRTEAWWGWNETKTALEWLFWAGLLTSRERLPTFERVYDLPERALPAEVLARSTPPRDEAMRGLVAVAAKALGVATELDLRRYFRLPTGESAQAVAELVEEGTLRPVRVRGWDAPAWLSLEDHATSPLKQGCRLLSPFDPLLFERPRVERLFDFHYRIEIYVPAEKRQYGYYCLPILLDDRLVGRVDARADRKAGGLVVESLHLEPHADPARIHPALAGELALVADWLGLSPP